MEFKNKVLEKDEYLIMELEDYRKNRNMKCPKHAKIDKADYGLISKYSWELYAHPEGCRPATNINGNVTSMQRIIISGAKVFIKSEDRFDLRRKNLTTKHPLTGRRGNRSMKKTTNREKTESDVIKNIRKAKITVTGETHEKIIKLQKHLEFTSQNATVLFLVNYFHLKDNSKDIKTNNSVKIPNVSVFAKVKAVLFRS
jgi:hypothetical protein